MSAVGLPPPDRTLQRLDQPHAERCGGRTAPPLGGLGLRYPDPSRAPARFAGALAAAGVDRGDRVALMAENRWEILQCLLACAWRGAVLVPINTASRGAQLAHILTNAGPSVVVAESALLSRITELERPQEV